MWLTPAAHCRVLSDRASCCCSPLLEPPEVWPPEIDVALLLQVALGHQHSNGQQCQKAVASHAYAPSAGTLPWLRRTLLCSAAAHPHCGPIAVILPGRRLAQ